MGIKHNVKKLIEDSNDLPLDDNNWWYILAYDPKVKLDIRFWLWAETKDKLDNLLESKGIDDVKWVRKEVPPFIPKGNIKRV